jgi:hypothetical protein
MTVRSAPGLRPEPAVELVGGLAAQGAGRRASLPSAESMGRSRTSAADRQSRGRGDEGTRVGVGGNRSFVT